MHVPLSTGLWTDIISMLMLLQAGVLAVVGWIITSRWWHLLDPQGSLRKLSASLHFNSATAALPPAVGASDRGATTLQHYLAPPIKRLARSFLAAWVSWALFYLAAAIGKFTSGSGHPMANGEIPGFWRNLLSNCTTFFLIQFYFELTAPRRRSISNREYERVILVGWLFIMLATTVFESLLVYREHVALNDIGERRKTFDMIYGLGQALALYLVIGRLENVFIQDHIRVNHPQRLRWYRGGIFLGYVFASLQPLYPLFDEQDPLGLFCLVAAALFLKLVFAAFLDMLFMPDRPVGALTPMQQHLYETERFTVEEISNFERDFLRHHMNQTYRKRYKERNIGYLGLEYAHLNEFKREHLHLNRFTGGLFVKEVYPGTDAMLKGIRPGDFITHLNHVPFGRNNTLSSMLEGIPHDEGVLLSIARKHLPHKSIHAAGNGYHDVHLHVHLGNYEKLVKPRRLAGAQPRIRMTYVHNHTDAGAGVVCRYHTAHRGSQDFVMRSITSRATGLQYDIPDISTLRTVLNWLHPGDVLLISDDPLSTGHVMHEGLNAWPVTSAIDEHGDQPAAPGHLASPDTYALAEKEVTSELHRLYPALFGSAVDPKSSLSTIEPPDLLTLHLFNDRLEHLTGWHFVDQAQVSRFARHPIWATIPSGTVHELLCGSAGADRCFSVDHRLHDLTT